MTATTEASRLLNFPKICGYRFGSMVAFFHYSPIDILTVHLPPSVLDFSGRSELEWIKKEVNEVVFPFHLWLFWSSLTLILLCLHLYLSNLCYFPWIFCLVQLQLTKKVEAFYGEASDILCVMEQKSLCSKNDPMDSTDLHKHIVELKDLLDKEKSQYYVSIFSQSDYSFNILI